MRARFDQHAFHLHHDAFLPSEYDETLELHHVGLVEYPFYVVICTIGTGTHAPAEMNLEEMTADSRSAYFYLNGRT